MRSRRSVIKAVGAASIGAIGTASASSQSSTLDEIDDEVLEAYKTDGRDGVQQVMGEYGLDYEISSKESPKDESDFSTQDRHWEENSSIDINAFDDPSHDERIRVQAIAKLKTVRPRASSVAFVPDIFGISFDDDHWTVVGEESLRTDVDSVDISIFSGTLEEGAYAAEVTHSEPLEPFINVLLSASLRNTDGVLGQIFTTYEQTEHSFPWGSSPDVVIGGGGPLQVEFDSQFAGSWKMTANTDTDGII